MDADVAGQLGLRKRVVPVRGTRHLGKVDMIRNNLQPDIEVDPETYQVRVDGEVVSSQPASELALAQRYFLF